ncbi:MAG: hypothetical protein ABI068_12390 [Ktedonobacterales bacterium]
MATEQTETYNFVVGANPSLRIQHNVGQVTIRAGAAGEAHVEVTKRVRDGFFGSGAEADLEKVHVKVTQDGGLINIATRYDDSISGKRVTVDVAIACPAQVTLDTKLNAGTLDITGTQGKTNVQLNAGTADLSDVTLGDGSSFDVNAGTVNFQGALAEGASVSAQVNAGTIKLRLPQNTAADVDGAAQAGSISVSGWRLHEEHAIMRQRVSGALNPSASGGGRLHLHANAGSISLIAQ